MKIAICLPSYNESKNISNVTKIVDSGLSKYFSEHKCYIVNADNNSPDKTNEVFQKTQTKNEKISLICKEIGKGNNLLNFFKFCSQNNIDYACTIDSDVVSITPEWVKILINPQITENADYVVPLYKRSRFEASSTNHFAFPAIYSICGKYVRQPIAGDFGFSKKFIEMIKQKKCSDNIMKYGIDIFMTLNACLSGLKIRNVLLGKKIHSPSFGKMEKMFEEILGAFISILDDNLEFLEPIDLYPKCENFEYMTKSRNFPHKQFAIDKLEESTKYLKNNGFNISRKNIDRLYVKCFAKLINDIKNKALTREYVDIFKRVFIVRSTSFWLRSKKMSAKCCEQFIENQAKLIFKEINL